MASRPLTNVDTAWLRMEEPTNLMMISGVMIFSTRMDYQQLRSVIESRLLCFDRFRQRIVESRQHPGTYLWKDERTIDLDFHLQRISTPIPANETSLPELVSELMGTQLDFAHLLWQFHLIENYGSGSALICRVHHCIADGIALVQVLLSLTDSASDPTPIQPANVSNRITRLSPSLREASIEILVDPSRVIDLAKLGADGAAALGRLVLRIPDPPTIFKGELGVAKRAAWSQPVPLNEVKSISRATGGTVNDILITAMTGALRRYMEYRQQIVTDLEIRAAIPVNLRPLDEYNTLGNKFGLVFLSLPIGVADPLERLHKLKSRMDDIKGTPEAVVAFNILNIVGGTPTQIQDLVMDLFQTKGTTIMTNVPGPRETRFMAGSPLDTIMAWVPQTGRMGLGVSIISYAGHVLLGVATDQGLVPDPEKITAAFNAEFDQLSALAKDLDKRTIPGKLHGMSSQLDQAIKDLDDLLADK
jgi:diacylglycerol O-acyltransferase / wax synthase